MLQKENSGSDLNKNVELLDTPGILWPKFEDEQVGMRLAYIGSIKDDILNMEELALTLIDFLREKYAGVLEKRYQIQEEGTSVQILEAIARSRGCLKKGEELDYAKASLAFCLTISVPVRSAGSHWNGHKAAKEMKKIGEIKEEFQTAAARELWSLFMKNIKKIPEAVL